VEEKGFHLPKYGGTCAEYAERTLMLHGFDIFENRGRKMGDWFSIMGLIMTVEITGERRVIVYTPPIDTYR
jgi:hypothetical protein